MSNFNEDRRQSCVDFKCKPYRERLKITYIVMAINDINNRITDIKDK